MLQALHIENFAVIKCVDIELTDGLTVLTGETGAGKSILIDSVNLLLGGKFKREMIRAGENSAYVSAIFSHLTPEVTSQLREVGIPMDDADPTVSISRNVTLEGKSLFRVDGRPVSATTVRHIGALLLNIHGQNDNQKLLQKSSHLQLLDAMGETSTLRDDYAKVYQAWNDCRAELSSLKTSDAERVRRADMLAYQIRDIGEAKLKPGEEEALLTKRVKLQNAEKIIKQVTLVTTALDAKDKNGSAVYLLGRSVAALRQLSSLIPAALPLAEQLDSVMYDVRDIAEQVRAFCDEEEMYDDPTAALDAIENRLEQISRLKHKYGERVEDVIAFAERAKQELETLSHSQERVDELNSRLAKLEQECAVASGRLTDLRQRLAQEITERVRAELTFLDMPKVRFAVSVRPTGSFTPTGCDDVEFLIATNPGQDFMPLIQIASGGELARLMLAIKSVLNDRDGVGCVVFDEVDTGISGKTSRKVGMRLHRMAAHVQVICITHSAQIASLADTHARISKQEVDSEVQTQVTILDENGRVEEVARILGGIEITDLQRRAAEEMIEEGRKHR